MMKQQRHPINEPPGLLPGRCVAQSVGEGLAPNGVSAAPRFQPSQVDIKGTG